MSKKTVKHVAFDEAIEDFLTVLNEEHKISKEDLKKLLYKDGSIKIVNKGSKPGDKKVIPNTVCAAVLTSAQKRGQPCKQACSTSSTTGKYCCRHLKYDKTPQEEIKPKKIMTNKCVAIITAAGENKGKVCGQIVSDKSPSGDYCCRHMMRELAEKKLSELKKKGEPKKAVVTEEVKEEKKFTIKPKKSPYHYEDKPDQYVWEHEGSTYVIDKATRKVIGTEHVVSAEEMKAKLVPLTDDQKNAIKKTDPKLV